MIAIVDYGVGNLHSISGAVRMLTDDVVITSDKDVLSSADGIILPGVGAFGDAAEKLFETGLGDIVVSRAKAGVPLLGVCLGMQLLFEKSFEYGEHEGLSLIPGRVVPMADRLPAGLKVPHIGWNGLDIRQPHPLLAGVKDGECVYFVHSYYAEGCGDALIAETEYGIPLTAAVAKGNVMGCQFHPEKSGRVGLSILSAFAAL